MSRIQSLFSNLTHPALVAFTVAGDPDEETSLEVVRALIKGGADIIEFGLPFSDPSSDGPVIQQADIRALSGGMTTDRLFEMVRTLRRETETPIVILTYANLLSAYGLSRFYTGAADAGIDGIVIADVPVEEAAPFLEQSEKAGIDAIMMVSSTTSDVRMEKILTRGSGFIYMVAVLGVTGMRQDVDPSAINLLETVKTRTNLPVLPGFGISTPSQVKKWIKAGAGGVIVGSAIVKKIEENLQDNTSIPIAVQNLVQDLSHALRE